MILSDKSIRREMGTNLTIEPFAESLLQPSSYDLTLAGEFYYKDKKHRRSRLLLFPNQFILGCTLEHVSLSSKVVGQIHNKSTLRRQGLTICCDAGYVDPGFQGQLTLEIMNHGQQAIELKSGMRIGQITFHWLDQPCERPYGLPILGSHYQGQVGVTPAIS